MTATIPTRLRLTNKVIDDLCGLPPHQRSRRYWDTTVPDLCLQFSRAGTASFNLRYTKLDGTDGDFAIGRASRVSLDGARAIAKAALNDLELHQVDPVQARREQREDARTPRLSTFADLAEAYIASKASLRPGKADLDEVYFLRHYVLPEIGSMKFEKVTVQCVMDLVTRIKVEVGNRRRRKGADGKTTANACHRAIKRVYRWACNKELALRNPADFPCQFPVKRAKRRGRLNESRFALFWEEIAKQLDRDYSSKAGPLAILLFMVTDLPLSFHPAAT